MVLYIYVSFPCSDICHFAGCSKASVIPRLAYVNAVIEQVVQPLGGGAAQQNLFQSINSNLYNPLSLKKQSQLDS